MPLINQPSPTPPADQPWEPGYNPNMRCPVPPSTFTPDSAQQFYRGPTLPQFRAFAPPTLSAAVNSAGGGSITNNTTVQESSTTTKVTLQATTASASTAVLNPGQNYTTSLSMSRVFALLSVTSTAATRIRMYATSSAQTTDLARSSSASPAYGTSQGLILDLTLGTSPYSWSFSPVVVGSNGSSPASPITYITIGQIASMSGAISVTFTYIPIES